ncbi:entericidin [Pseudothioclava nitratireducens]|jgi:predicted small secreted protein|nr:entericidin [Defluviimonas nitratireducens]MDF1620646.1 entericidin [Defluviimonas nitratireducens]
MKALILIGTMALALAGCNTVAGIGDDISGGARQVQDWL